MTESGVKLPKPADYKKGLEASPLIRFNVRNALGILVVAVCTVASLLVIMVMNFNRYESKERLALTSEFREQIAHMDTILGQVTAGLDAMKTMAEADLEQTRGRKDFPMPFPADTFEQFGAYFHLDAMADDRRVERVGNLTGWGVYRQKSVDVRREIRAALVLNPLFASARKSISTSAWIYYLSASSFINLYPFVHSSEWKFDSMTYNKDFYRMGVPEANPDQSFYWTQVYVDEAGKGLMTTGAVPVYDQGRFLGILAIDLTIDFLNRIVAAFRPEQGTLFLVNTQGQILAHPDIASSSDPSIKSFQMAVPEDFGLKRDDFILLPEYKVAQVDNHLLIVGHLENAPWQAVYLEPVLPIWTRVLERIGPAPLVLFFVMLTIVVTVFVSNYFLFVRPSDRFVRYIMELNQGRFDLDPGPVPEMWRPWFSAIDTIFHENDSLTRKMRHYNEELEDRVIQRTRELVQLNQTLKMEIVKRERAQEEEKKTAHILDQAISQSPSGIIIADAADLHIQRVNKAAFDIRGGRREGEEIKDIHTHFSRWKIYDDRGRPCTGRALPLHQAVREDKVTRNRVMVVKDDNGKDRWLSVNAAPIRNAVGKIISGIVMFHDISSLKERELALHASEAQNRRLKDLYKQLSDASFEAIFLSKEGVCIGQNMMAETMFGYSLEEALGRPGLSWMAPESRLLVAKQISSGFEGQYEALAQRKDGSIFPCEIQARITGKTGIRITALRDITDRRRAEQEKLDALAFAATQTKHALVGQVAGKMAHDFNNILGVIMGNVELAMTDCEDSEMADTLALILGQTIRGKNLTRNLVAFAQDQEPKQARFSINKKIKLVLELMQKDLAGIRVVNSFQDKLPDLIADPGMIEHMLVNMIQNSVHALGKTQDPEIFIRTFGKPDTIAFEIRDNGCGIPESSLNRIYEPSFTLKGSRDVDGQYLPDTRGTGYGMANVKKYLEQHKGEIHVQSTQGQGTRFIIELPVVDMELTPEEKEEVLSHGIGPGRRILLVEDEVAISDIQSRVLTADPCLHEVDVVDNGERAVEMFRTGQYDLVSLDYVLPGEMTGIDVYHRIRETDTRIPVLFISGNIEFLESIKTLKAEDPWIDHLSKPCLNKAYVQALHSLLGRSESGAKDR